MRGGAAGGSNKKLYPEVTLGKISPSLLPTSLTMDLHLSILLGLDRYATFKGVRQCTVGAYEEQPPSSATKAKKYWLPQRNFCNSWSNAIIYVLRTLPASSSPSQKTWTR